MCIKFAKPRTVNGCSVFTCEQRRQVDFFEVSEIHHVNIHGRRAIQRRTPTCTRRRTRIVVVVVVVERTD